MYGVELPTVTGFAFNYLLYMYNPSVFVVLELCMTIHVHGQFLL